MRRHPYYPRDLSLPTWTANELPTLSILAGFFGACALVIAFGWRLSRGCGGTGDRWTAVWFLLCGCIHVLFEGYYAITHQTLPASQSWPAQAWKEYALADSRYLTGHSTVLGIEILTAALKGPLCFWTVYAILTGHSTRYSSQLLVSFGQLYGCVLYYLTSALEGFPDSHPAPQYFYGYFVLMNLPWIVIPVLLVRQSIRILNRAGASAPANRTPKKRR